MIVISWSLKQRMRQALDRRLLVTELYVVVAMLDPSQHNLNAVQEYLSERGMTAVDSLSLTGDPAVRWRFSRSVTRREEPRN